MSIQTKIESYLRKYTVLPADESYLILSLWCIHSWAIDYARATPYIYLHSPEKGSGKTRVLEVLETLIKNPIRATSITPSALFRVIEDYEPTLLIDEVDTIFSGAKHADLRGVLNSGYRRGGYVFRMHKGNPTPFNTFGAKILAGIYNLHLPDTIRDRSIPIVMRKKRDDEIVDAFYADEVQHETDPIIEEMVGWIKKNKRDLGKIKLDPIDEISDRQWEIAEPLVIIGSLLGMEHEAREAVKFLFKTVEGHKSKDTSIFQLINEAFADDDKIFTEDLLNKLGGVFTAKTLARQLQTIGIEPRLIRIGNNVRRGYTKSDFASALGEL